MATNHFDRWSRIKWFFVKMLSHLSLLSYCWTMKVAVIKLDLFYINYYQLRYVTQSNPSSLFLSWQNKPIPFISSIRFDLALMGNVKMTHSTRLVRCKITSSLHQIPLKIPPETEPFDKKKKITSHREYKIITKKKFLKKKQINSFECSCTRAQESWKFKRNEKLQKKNFLLPKKNFLTYLFI